MESSPSNTKSSTPTELFRFVHIKKTGLFSGETLETDFISAPTLPEKDGSFVSIKKVSEVKGINNKLFVFGIKLKKSKNLTIDELAQWANGISPLKDTERETVWNNLIYQLETNESPRVTQAVIRMIQADNFISKFIAESKDNRDASYWGRVSAASVVIPNELVPDRKKPLSPRESEKLDATSKKILSQKLEYDIAKDNQGQLRKISKELIEAEKTHSKAVDREYRKVLSAHQKSIARIVEDARKVAEPDDEGFIQLDIDKDRLPVFDFTPQDVFETEYLNGLVSGEALQIISFLKKDGDSDLLEINKRLEAIIREEYERMVGNLPEDSLPSSYQGIIIPKRTTPIPNSFILKAEPVVGKPGYYTFYATQYFEDSSRRIKTLSVTIVENEEDLGSSASYRVVQRTDHFATYQLFEDGIPLDPKGQIDIEADYTTEDGTASGNISVSSHPTSIPVIGMELCDGEPGVPGNPMYGVTNLGVAEYKRVEQKLCCYVEGEVSHIENIMAKEYKERATRNLTRSELTTEVTTEREVEDLTDTTSTDRYELQTEISNTLNEDKSKDFGANASVSGDLGKIRFSAGANFSTSSSSSVSNSYNESESYAKEVVERAMKRVVEKTSRKRTSRMLREFEETNKHGFDNRKGKDHVTGIYRWVDKIYENRLMNYGKRLMYEFMIPEPSKNFKNYIVGKEGGSVDLHDCSTYTPTRPPSLKDMGINNYTDLEHWNYPYIAGKYGIEVEPHPHYNININKAIAENVNNTGAASKRYQGNTGPNHDHTYQDGAYAWSIEIPEGYGCTSYYGKVDMFHYGHPGDNGAISASVLIGKDLYFFAFDGTQSVHGSIPEVEEELGISIRTRHVGTVHLNITARCWLKDETQRLWRQNTYILLKKAYDERMQEYNDYMTQKCAEASQGNVGVEESNDYNINPLMSRAIEKRELKKTALQYITQSLSLVPSMGKESYVEDEDNGNFKVNRSSSFETYTAHIKFLEEAFDWEIMAYELFPYYWAAEDNWEKLLKTTSKADFIFQAFLQSGMAKMVVPVKAGYEKAALFYLDTGIILDLDAVVSDGTDGLYQSALEDLMLVDKDGIEGPYEEARWETKIPSSLTIIQDGANPLAEDGLPCFCANSKPIAAANGNPNELVGELDETDTEVE